MATYQAFLLGVMAACTPGMIFLALTLRKLQEKDDPASSYPTIQSSNNQTP